MSDFVGQKNDVIGVEQGCRKSGGWRCSASHQTHESYNAKPYLFFPGSEIQVMRVRL
jgi:hypothetical protein